MFMDSTQEKFKYIDELLRDAFFASSRAMKILFEFIEKDLSKNQEKRNELSCALYMNKAISLMSSAKALYYSHIEKLERSEYEDIFNAFERLNNEFLASFSAEHSYQHTDLYFDDYKQLINSFLGIES